VLDVDTLMAAIMDAEGQRSRDIGRDLPLKTAVLHKRRCSTRASLKTLRSSSEHRVYASGSEQTPE